MNWIILWMCLCLILTFCLILTVDKHPTSCLAVVPRSSLDLSEQFVQEYNQAEDGEKKKLENKTPKMLERLKVLLK